MKLSQITTSTDVTTDDAFVGVRSGVTDLLYPIAKLIAYIKTVLGLQQVTDVNATTTNDMTVNDGVNGKTVMGSGKFQAYDASGNMAAELKNNAGVGRLTLRNSTGGTNVIETESTAGTLAAFIPAYNGTFLQSVMPIVGKADADFTAKIWETAMLRDITANRTITIPAASAQRMLRFINHNTTGFLWNVTGGTLKDRNNLTITSIVNGTTYTFLSDGTNWYQIQ